MSDQFKVVFTGKLSGESNVEDVITAFAGKFKCSEDKARALITSGKETPIKSGLDQVKAEKYQSVLNSLGMETELVAIQKTPGFELEGDEPGKSASDSAVEGTDASADTATCPKCGSNRIKDDNCLACGIIISKYLTLQASEDQANVYTPPTPVQGLSATQADSSNPYQAPEADLSQEFEEGDLTGPVSVPVSHGWRWLSQGFSYFRQNPLAWILAMVIWIILSSVISMVPFVGSLAITLLGPVIGAGFMLGCQDQDQGDDFKVGHLFAGFSNNVGQLMLVGLIYLVLMIGVFVIIGLMAGGATLFLGGGNPAMMDGAAASAIILPMLIGFLLFFPVLMAYWFAPVLVALNGISALTAMKMSFSACLKNMLPFLLFSIVALLLFIIGMIPLGLGLLVVLPMITASMYVAYRDIFFG